MTAPVAADSAPLALARMLRDTPRPDGGYHPAYQLLAHAVRTLILEGRISPSTRVPAERELASALGMSRTTVTAAYDLLRREAILRSRPGAGTWAAVPGVAVVGVEAGPGELRPEVLLAAGLGAELEPGALSAAGAGADLRRGALSAAGPHTMSPPVGSPTVPPSPRPAFTEVIDLSRPVLGPAAGFPTEDAARVLAEAPALAAHLSDPDRHPAGLPELRAAIAERYTRRGLPTAPDQIVVTGGASAALALVAGLLCGPEDRVLVENPTCPAALAVLRSSPLRLVPVPAGGDGTALAAVFAQSVPRMAYLSAGYQTPTGTLRSADERLAAVDAARRVGAWLVADESAIEPVLDGDAPDPFALGVPRATAEQIITVGSPARTHACGLRVGWIRATAGTAAALARRQAATGHGASVLDQIIAVELLRRGAPAPQDHRPPLRERRAALEAALSRFLPQWSWRTPAGGLALWVDIGRPSASALARRAAEAGVRIAEGPRFAVDPGAFDQRIHLPYTLPPAVLTEAVRRLAAAWNQTGSAPAPGSPPAPTPPTLRPRVWIV